MKVIRAAVAAVLSLALGVFGFTAFVPTASAYAPSVTATCEGVTVDLVNYQIDPGQKETFKTVHHDAVSETFTTIHHDAVPETFTTVRHAAVPETFRTVPHDAVTHVVHHVAVIHTEWKYAEHSGPHQMWLHNDTYKYVKDGVGTDQKPDYGTYYERTSVTKVVIDTAAYDETVIDHAAYNEQVGNHDGVAAYDTQVGNGDGKAAWSEPPVSNGDGKAAWDESVSNHDGRSENLTPNHVIVIVNGAKKLNIDFGAKYNGAFPFVAGQSNTYKVVVTAWDDPTGSKEFTKTFEGTEAACVVPSTSITVTFPEPTAPTCDEPGALPSTPVQDHVTFTWSEDHLTLTAHAAEGYVLKGDISKTYTEPGAALGYQNTEDDQCHVPPMLEPATTVVTDAKWGCGDTVTGTTSVTTTYTFEFDSVDGSYSAPIAHVGESVIGSRDLSTEEILLYQNTDSKGLCYVPPMTKDATTVVTTAKWACNDKTAVTSSVTTAYSFAFDSKTGTYGPAIAKAGTPVVGTHNLTATEFVACPVLAVEPVPSSSAAPVVTQDVLASTGANDVTPWGVGAGLLALLTGAGLLIARKKA